MIVMIGYNFFPKHVLIHVLGYQEICYYCEKDVSVLIDVIKKLNELK